MARRLSKRESRERWAQLRALVNEWDPIGVMNDPAWPRDEDEYECLVGPLMRLLESGAPETEIEGYLRDEVRDHFGIDPSHLDIKEISNNVDTWFKDNWKGTLV